MASQRHQGRAFAGDDEDQLRNAGERVRQGVEQKTDVLFVGGPSDEQGERSILRNGEAGTKLGAGGTALQAGQIVGSLESGRS